MAGLRGYVQFNKYNIPTYEEEMTAIMVIMIR